MYVNLFGRMGNVICKLTVLNLKLVLRVLNSGFEKSGYNFDFKYNVYFFKKIVFLHSLHNMFCIYFIIYLVGRYIAVENTIFY